MRKNSGLPILFLLLALLFVVGITLLVVASYEEAHHLTHDLFRDIGIAFLVSGLVTGAYEAYARTRFDLGKISALLETVYGSGVPPAVWESIKDNLLRRELIRRNVIVHLRVSRSASDHNTLVLEVDLAYDLQSLLSKDRDFTVSHGLDEHITGRDLPRFVDVSIDSRSESVDGDPWQTHDGVMKVNNGQLDLRVSLRSLKAELPVSLRIRRHEVRQCPGSYYLIMTEVTDGLRVYLDECAEDVKVSLMIRPREGSNELNPGDVRIVDGPLLPGHGMEFKFTNRVLLAQEVAVQPAVPSVTMTPQV